mmetsp:Transcript_65425/g.200382  ORF Transcript_65425/g.200382 Transcript_65425/m.200382 type:complete len:220 (+) Transcript_65425:297-956(+)
MVKPAILSNKDAGGIDSEGKMLNTALKNIRLIRLKAIDDTFVMLWNIPSDVERTHSAMGRRSASYDSRSFSGAWPLMTEASFHAKFAASCKPVFMPWPPAGEWQCAASPARYTRPLLYALASLHATSKNAMSLNSVGSNGPGAGMWVCHFCFKNSGVNSSRVKPFWQKYVRHLVPCKWIHKRNVPEFASRTAWAEWRWKPTRSTSASGTSTSDKRNVCG